MIVDSLFPPILEEAQEVEELFQVNEVDEEAEMEDDVVINNENNQEVIHAEE
jgi:hypothetical protein